MARVPKMDGTASVVALIACVLDSRDGATLEEIRNTGHRVGEILADDPADYVTCSAFVGAALAELAAEAMRTTPERVLQAILAASDEGRDQVIELGKDDQGPV